MDKKQIEEAVKAYRTIEETKKACKEKCDRLRKKLIAVTEAVGNIFANPDTIRYCKRKIKQPWGKKADSIKWEIRFDLQFVEVYGVWEGCDSDYDSWDGFMIPFSDLLLECTSEDMLQKYYVKNTTDFIKGKQNEIDQMKLITKEIEEAIRNTPYGSTDEVDRDERKVIARYFNPYGSGTWYVLENDDYDCEEKVVFGAVTLEYDGRDVVLKDGDRVLINSKRMALIADAMAAFAHMVEDLNEYCGGDRNYVVRSIFRFVTTIEAYERLIEDEEGFYDDDTYPNFDISGPWYVRNLCRALKWARHQDEETHCFIMAVARDLTERSERVINSSEWMTKKQFFDGWIQPPENCCCKADPWDDLLQESFDYWYDPFKY